MVSPRMLVRFLAAGAVAVLVAASAAFALLSDSSTIPVGASPAEDEIGVAAGPLGGGQEFVPGELIVRFRPSVSAAGKSDLLANEGAQLSRDLLLPRHSLVKVPEGREDEFLARLAKNPRVESVERNGIVRAVFTPNDYYYYLQWDMPQIEMPSAWDVADGSGVTVAVIDTGVAYENYSIYAKAPDLAGTCFVPGYDFINGDAHPNDDNGHGTHVAGTIAETTNNGIAMAGVAPGACIMPIKVLADDGFGSYAGVADGISWATDHGAQVINLSLTGSYSSSVEDAVNYALANDVVVVAATGNGGDDQIGDPSPGCPACHTGVLAVGATDYNMDRTYYSNYGCSGYGGCLDIMAPGGDVYADENDDGYGDGILQETLGIWCDPSVPPGDYTTFRYCFGAGTSMAAPHVAAAAALILETNPSLTADEVRDVLSSTATDLGTPGYDLEYGYGLVDVYAAVLMADDLDLDGVSNGEDNCLLVPNPDQVNTDGQRRPNGPQIPGEWASNPAQDELGDACDSDDDNDWMLDTGAHPVTGVPGEDTGCGSGPTNPLLADTDGDTAIDGAECALGSDPNDYYSYPTLPLPDNDNDGDGLPTWLDNLLCPSDGDGDGLVGDNDPDCDSPQDVVEFNDGREFRKYGVDPAVGDTDGDVCPDWVEIVDLDGNRASSISDVYTIAGYAFPGTPVGSVETALCDLDGNLVVSINDVYLAALNSTWVRGSAAICTTGE
jgi:serine protease